MKEIADALVKFLQTATKLMERELGNAGEGSPAAPLKVSKSRKAPEAEPSKSKVEEVAAPEQVEAAKANVRSLAQAYIGIEGSVEGRTARQQEIKEYIRKEFKVEKLPELSYAGCHATIAFLKKSIAAAQVAPAASEAGLGI